MGHFLLQASSCPDSLPLSEQMMPVNVSLPNLALAHLCLISAPIFHPSLFPLLSFHPAFFAPSSFLLPNPQSSARAINHSQLTSGVPSGKQFRRCC
jgi:hypothetical protein